MKLQRFTIVATLVTLVLCTTVISADQLQELDSSQFQYSYEGDVMPDSLAMFEVGSAFTDYTQTLATEGEVDYLDVNCDLNLSGWTSYTAMGTYKASDSVWGSEVADLGYTVELNIRINSQGKGTRGTFEVMAGTSASDQRMTISIGNGVKWNDPSGYNAFKNLYTDGGTGEINNRDEAFHTFRVAASPNGGGYDYQVWRDNEILSYSVADGGAIVLQGYSTDFSILDFGDPSSNEVSGHYDLDYFRFTPGAYQPVVTPLVPGDANNDGKVDGSDVTILAGNWQAGVGAPDPLTVTWEMGDFNEDGQVDGSDVTILAGNWQAGVTATTASVPEPSTIMLLIAALVSMVAIHRRK